MLRIPEENLRCVAFLTVDEPDGNNVIHRVPKATAFFVGVRAEDTPHRVDYIITARHCIEEAGANRPLFIRFNTVASGYIEVETNTNDWFASESDDVAIVMGKPGGLPPGITHKEIDGNSISLSAFVGADYWYRGPAPEIGQIEIQPGVGNEVYLTGLFTADFGESRNLPVARFGHISRMPSRIELLSGNIRFDVVAYLMEFHSWGGQSGSPVFFVYPITIQGTDGGFDTGYISGLLGLVSAHYDIKRAAGTTGDILGDILVPLNSGMAVVTPAEAIRQLILRDDVMQQRKELIARAAHNGPAPTLDFAGSD